MGALTNKDSLQAFEGFWGSRVQGPLSRRDRYTLSGGVWVHFPVLKMGSRPATGL